MKNIKNELGFSLLEVCLAVGIMAILTALAIPQFTGMIPSVKSKASMQTSRNCVISNQLDSLAAQANGTTASAATC